MILTFDNSSTTILVGLVILFDIVGALSLAAILFSDDEWWPTAIE